jgi:DNA repair protein RecN (Recombination protein N)
MLKLLRIQNYAVVADVEVSFDSGLNIITGETGAGKSIVIGSIGLLTGESATADIVRKGTEKTIVEGQFTCPDTSLLADLTEELDLTVDDQELIVRREMSTRGRSRAFINDSPVRLALLKHVTRRLLDLHGQHQHQSLLHTELYHLLVDSFGGIQVQAETVTAEFRELRRLEQELRTRRNELEQARKEQELAQFQLEEIARYQLQPGEDAALEQDIRLATNMERILQTAQDGCRRLLDDDKSVSNTLRELLRSMETLTDVDPRFGDVRALLDNAATAVEESSAILQRLADIEEFSPEALEQSRQRLSELATLKRKYHRSLEEILALRDSLQQETGRVDELEKLCGDLTERVDTTRSRFAGQCLDLSEQRLAIAKRMGPEISKGLQKLGMTGAQFQCRITRRESISGNITSGDTGYTADEHGIDDIAFYIATNKGEDLKPLARIASGGEISRVMLAIKTALADHDRIPVLVFDEIDIGISGRIARVVGEQLLALSRYHQILCVTHLPQIAGLGDRHYVARKATRGKRVYSTLSSVPDDERDQEIAKLIGGDTVTPAALESARELLGKKPELSTHG